jgi:hypothetical protein
LKKIFQIQTKAGNNYFYEFYVPQFYKRFVKMVVEMSGKGSHER